MSTRDYNKEFKDNASRNYGYSFDFDVMQPFMLKSFEPFFVKGSLLELGCFQGRFTEKLLPYFDDITCVEASDAAMKTAQEILGDKATFFNSRFEDAELPSKYDNIIMTHVLEHIDDPVSVLIKIKDEWLSDFGRFFLVCPNANAASRQIAVNMGLITHNAAVTPSEELHGHRITYSLDTLKRDARAAGFKVAHESGIFFKALANFQWDQAIEKGIVSQEYLEGCYELGLKYPELCSSIFLLLEKYD